MTFTANFILDGKTAACESVGSPRWRFALLFVFEMSGAWFSYWLGRRRKHARKIQRLQLMSTLSTSSPMQLALVDYLSTRRYDAHLRRLRRQLAERKQRAWQALLRYLPAEVKIHHNDSGYFLWLELPEPLDAGELSLAALTHHISIAPGKMFSTGENWSRFFRFNTAWQWGEREEQAVKQLGKLIQERL